MSVIIATLKDDTGRIMVQNQSGQKVLETTHLNQGWDGCVCLSFQASWEARSGGLGLQGQTELKKFIHR
jgi:hypothetical protein